jgi:acyl-CoA reductase-like NAD-dependent aldehyde dehydrogenase
MIANESKTNSSKQSEQSEQEEFSFLVGGKWRDGTPYVVRCPYDGQPVATVHRAGREDLEQATQAAVRAFEVTRKLAAHHRAAILRAVAATIIERAEELARTIALEAGKPVKQARIEVGRAGNVFTIAAEESSRFQDEVLHLDAVPGGEKRQGLLKRFPIGPVAAITPFNFPLLLSAHKLAPAIAAGCPVVHKPASQTPISALKLGRIILECGWPPEALSVLPMSSADATGLVEDERFKLLTFTGSPAVGWELKSRAGAKKVTLELGGNAAVIVHSDADLAKAAERCVAGGFSYAGQSCISVQRIFVQEQVYGQFVKELVPRVNALKVSHPLDEAADLSSLITEQDAMRVNEWLEEARAAGAEYLVGGTVEGGVVHPTIVAKAGPELRVNCKEIFAPVVTVQPYTGFEDALTAVNASAYGLQAGVFTNDVARIFRAYEELEVGGVMVNEIPSWRVDSMPYGGVKQSGFGREGLKYAIEEMTEPKLLVINLP